MATREQIEANRRNARLSTGPKDTGRSRFNGLKHGLCAEHVVLPGEDPADFEAEREAWFDDWRPLSHTRAVLVERAAVASWKLRRATRAEAVRLYEAGADAAHEFDLAQRERVEGALHVLPRDPGSALVRLRCDPAGLDRLIGLWEELAEAAAAPSGWASREDHHDRLLNLLGHPSGSEPEGLGVARASLRLLAGDDTDAADLLRAFCLGRAEEVRRERSKFWDPSVLRRRTIDLACAPVSKEAQLLHRYEMAHEQSLRAAIRGLLALEKSGADLPDRDDGSEPAPGPRTEPTAASAAGAGAVADGPRGAVAAGESDTSCDIVKTYAELASVGAAPSAEVRPGVPAGSSGRRREPSGADPGSGAVPNRR